MRNILHLTSYYNTSRLYGLLFAELALLGFRQTVASPRGIDNSYAISTVDYIGKEVWGGLDRLLFRRKIEKYCGLVRPALCNTTPHLIHAHTLYSDGFAAYSLACELEIPFVVTIRSTDIYKFAKYYKYLNRDARNVVNMASGVIFLNSNYVSKLESALDFKINRSKVKVLPNGIDDLWFKEEPIRRPAKSSDFVVVTVGDLIARKNQKVILDAVSAYNDAGGSARLILIGNYDTVYGRMLKQKFNSELVLFEGVKTQEEIREIFGYSDLFVLLSKVETFGLVYAEALSQGLPIVATRGQGFQGWGESSDWCKFLRSDDVKGLVEILNNQEMRAEPVFSAVEFCREKFNWRYIAEEMRDFYVHVS